MMTWETPSDDDDRSYRPREVVEEAKSHHDPLHLFESYVRSQQLLDDATVDGLRAEVKAEIDEAITEAWNAADPDPRSLGDHVFG